SAPRITCSLTIITLPPATSVPHIASRLLAVAAVRDPPIGALGELGLLSRCGVQIWLFWCGGQGSRLYPGELTAVDSVGRHDPGRPRPGRDAADLVRRIVEGSTSPDSNDCLPWPGRRI